MSVRGVWLLCWCQACHHARMRKLTSKQQAFVNEYLVDLNATQAAMRAGYSKRTAQWQGPQLLRKTHVAAAISEAKARRAARVEITQDRVLEEIARLALFDIRKLVNDDGTPRPLQELDDDTAAAIGGIDIARVGNAEVGVGEVLKFKLIDKARALEMLGKHLGIFEKDNKQKGQGAAAELAALLSGVVVGVKQRDAG